MAYRQPQPQGQPPGGPPSVPNYEQQQHQQQHHQRSQSHHKHSISPSQQYQPVAHNQGWPYAPSQSLPAYQSYQHPMSSSSGGGAGAAITPTSFHAPTPMPAFATAGLPPYASTSKSPVAPSPAPIATSFSGPPTGITFAGQLQPPRKRIAQSACETCRKKRTRCVVEPSSLSGECNNCTALGIECVFSGVDKRKESVKDLRGRVAYLEQMFGRLRSATSDTEVKDLMQEVRSDAALNGRLAVESSRDRSVAGNAVPSGVRDSAVMSPDTKKRRMKYGGTDIDSKSDTSDNDTPGKIRGDSMRHDNVSDLSDSAPQGEDDLVTAQLTEMVDR